MTAKKPGRRKVVFDVDDSVHRKLSVLSAHTRVSIQKLFEPIAVQIVKIRKNEISAAENPAIELSERVEDAVNVVFEKNA